MTDIPKFEGRDREWRGYLNIRLESLGPAIPFAFRETDRGFGERLRRRSRANSSIVIRPNAPLPLQYNRAMTSLTADCVCFYTYFSLFLLLFFFFWSNVKCRATSLCTPLRIDHLGMRNKAGRRASQIIFSNGYLNSLSSNSFQETPSPTSSHIPPAIS